MELREKIARILIRDRSQLKNFSENMNTDINDVFSLIKEAGYMSPEEVNQWLEEQDARKPVELEMPRLLITSFQYKSLRLEIK